MTGRITFDARMAQASGIGTFIRGLLPPLLRQWADQSPRGTMRILGSPSLRDMISHSDGLPSETVFAPFEAPIYSLREHWQFPRSAEATDGYHIPHYNVPVGLRRPVVANIHDLIHLAVPEVLASRAKQAVAAALLRHAARSARRILVLSNHTKGDLMERLRVPESKIIVCGAAAGTMPPLTDQDVEDHLRGAGIASPYFLSVGNSRPHKNYEFLLRVYTGWAAERNRRDAQVPALVLCGVDGPDAGPLQTLADAVASNGARVHLLQRPIRMDFLAALYAGARGVVVPSLYEGFGLPVLEAQQAGIPVACSTATSLPEVAGDAAVFFDPRSEQELRAALTVLADDDARCKILSSSGRYNASKFTWDSVASQVVSAYHAALYSA